MKWTFLANPPCSSLKQVGNPASHSASPDIARAGAIGAEKPPKTLSLWRSEAFFRKDVLFRRASMSSVTCFEEKRSVFAKKARSSAACSCNVRAKAMHRHSSSSGTQPAAPLDTWCFRSFSIVVLIFRIPNGSCLISEIFYIKIKTYNK